MLKLDPYLNFDGTCEEAFNFYRSVFGGEFKGGIMRLRCRWRICSGAITSAVSKTGSG